MSIFRRDNEPSASPEPASPPQAAARPRQAPAAGSRAATQIAAGSKVVGEISGSAELIIEGEVEGEIDLDSQVVVGSQGRVKGQINARNVQVGGKVLGNVRGLERVEVLNSGSLEGDVISPRVVIAEGAFFKGKVEMTDKVSGGKQVAPAVAKGNKQHGGDKKSHESKSGSPNHPKAAQPMSRG